MIPLWWLLSPERRVPRGVGPWGEIVATSGSMAAGRVPEFTGAVVSGTFALGWRGAEVKRTIASKSQP